MSVTTAVCTEYEGVSEAAQRFFLMPSQGEKDLYAAVVNHVAYVTDVTSTIISGVRE